ncbi:hypothetical protein D3C79_927970 [compost metagenome]
MAAGHHRRQLGVTARAAGEYVADGVDADRATGRLAPLHEQIAGLAVEVGQGQAADTALGSGAEPGQVHQRLPQAGAVDVTGVGLQDLFDGGHGLLLQASYCLYGPLRGLKARVWPTAPGCVPPNRQARRTVHRPAASR